MKVINTPDAPKAIGPYSQAVIANGLLFTSGQIAINPKTNQIEATAIEEQTKQVMENLKALLAASNASFDKVVKQPFSKRHEYFRNRQRNLRQLFCQSQTGAFHR